MREKRIQIEGQDTPYLIRDNGTVWSEKRNRVLKGTIKRNEYQTVYLTHNNKQYNLMIHRLVAEAFCPNPNNYTIVHHRDNNSLNNCAENLEWVTRMENIHHAIKTGLKKFVYGSKNPCSKLTDEDVIYIRTHHPEFSVKTLSQKFNVSKTTIQRVIQRKTYTDIE